MCVCVCVCVRGGGETRLGKGIVCQLVDWIVCNNTQHLYNQHLGMYVCLCEVGRGEGGEGRQVRGYYNYNYYYYYYYCTGLPWNITLRKAENREEWRKLVVKSTVVPQRSARLRDR